MSEQLRFGILSYVNCLPATFALESGAVGGGELKLTKGSPAELNSQMAAGDMDVSLVSTAEFLNRRERYRRLPGFSLWCDGWVESVTLYSPSSKEELLASKPTVAVTPESATSVALTQILLPDCYTLPFQSLEEARNGLTEGRYQGVLLIGDKALQPPDWCASYQAHDLGAWWKEKAYLPMTYAVWVARADLDKARIELATKLLEESLEWGRQHKDEVLAEGLRRCPLDRARLDDYFQRIHFQTTQKSAEGLLEFGGRLVLNRLLGRPRRMVGI